MNIFPVATPLKKNVSLFPINEWLCTSSQGRASVLSLSMKGCWLPLLCWCWAGNHSCCELDSNNSPTPSSQDFTPFHLPQLLNSFYQFSSNSLWWIFLKEWYCCLICGPVLLIALFTFKHSSKLLEIPFIFISFLCPNPATMAHFNKKTAT